MGTLVMGVLNVTPDSFYDGGRYFESAAAIAHGKVLIAEGADIIDVGGESSRPGADPVPLKDELSRVLPVIDALAGQVRISIDTMKPEVAEAAIQAGATLLNDVSSSLAGLAGAHGVGLVVMHMQGRPKDMQVDPHYERVLPEVCALLVGQAERAAKAGVGEIYVDPGIGFGKTKAHNLALLAGLPDLVALGWPVLVGTSRKAFLGSISSPEAREALPPTERFEASLATAVFAMAAGVAVVRVHDVKAAKQGALIVGDVLGAMELDRSVLTS